MTAGASLNSAINDTRANFDVQIRSKRSIIETNVISPVLWCHSQDRICTQNPSEFMVDLGDNLYPAPDYRFSLLQVNVRKALEVPLNSRPI